MSASTHFEIIVDDTVHAHFNATPRKDRAAILDVIEQQLTYHHPRFVQLIEEARRRVRVSGGVSFAEFRNQMEARDDTVDDDSIENDEI